MVTFKELLRSDIASLQDELAVRKAALRAWNSQEQGFLWEALSDRLGILHDPEQRHGWQQMGYIGFATKREAQQCARAIKHLQDLNQEPKIRKAQRLTHCKWEIKAAHLTSDVLLGLISGSQAA